MGVELPEKSEVTMSDMSETPIGEENFEEASSRS